VAAATAAAGALRGRAAFSPLVAIPGLRNGLTSRWAAGRAFPGGPRYQEDRELCCRVQLEQSLREPKRGFQRN
jgi:hypothetical protein